MCCTNMRCVEQRREKPPQSPILPWNWVDRIGDPALQLEVEQQFEQLGARLREISPRAYATLILHRCHGLPLQEISERIGASYSMTKKYLGKALRFIEAELEASREV